MQHLLVTGGSGFIGSDFIRFQLGTYPNLKVTNLDKLTYAGNPENLIDWEKDPRYQHVKGDILDRQCIGDILMSGVDAVINFAAETHVDRSILDSGPFVQTNVVGTQVLLDATREAKICRYVQISTDEVYGSLGDEGAFTENTPLAPNSPYAASKTAADLLVRSYIHTFDFPGLITRCSNNYGPHQFPEKVIPLFLNHAMNDRPLPLYGKGDNVRDWIFVRDHSRAIDAVLRRGQTGEIYNIGGRCELTNLELAHQLLDSLKKPHDLIQFVEDRPGHDLRYAIDCSKIQNDLSWYPETSFDKGIKETIEWYQSHTDWIKRIENGEYRNYYQQQYGTRLSSS